MTFKYDGNVVTVKDETGAMVLVGYVKNMKRFKAAAESWDSISFGYLCEMRVFVRTGEGRCLVVTSECPLCGNV